MSEEMSGGALPEILPLQRRGHANNYYRSVVERGGWITPQASICDSETEPLARIVRAADLDLWEHGVNKKPNCTYPSSRQRLIARMSTLTGRTT